MHAGQKIAVLLMTIRKTEHPMKAILKTVLAAVFLLSLAALAMTLRRDWEVRAYCRTTAEITFIGLPEGNVLGNYIDCSGKAHFNEPMYLDSSLSGYRTDVEQYFGKTVEILISPENGRIVSYRALVLQNAVCGAAFLLSGGLLLLGILRKKRHRREESQ